MARKYHRGGLDARTAAGDFSIFRMRESIPRFAPPRAPSGPRRELAHGFEWAGLPVVTARPIWSRS